MTKKIICLGGEGDAATIGYAIRDANKKGHKQWEFAGFLNDRIEAGTSIKAFPVLGTLDQTDELLNNGFYFINAIYRIDGNLSRISMFEKLKIPDSRLATFIHPSAYVAQDVKIGPGCAIMPFCGISPGVKIGKGCILLQHAVVGHDTVIDDYGHIAAKACIGSCCKIAKGTHIGMNASVIERTHIGPYSTLGMGSALTQSIGEQEIWFGVPARFLRKTCEGQ